MKHYKVFIYILALIIIYGCENNIHTIKQFEKFPLNRNIEVKNILLDSTNYIDYSVKIIQHDSIIYILDIGKSTDFFVHCYLLPKYEYLKSIFKRGQGPNEYISINNIQISNDTLYAYGVGNEVFFTSVKSDELNSTIKKIKFNNDYGSLVRGFKIKNKFYFSVFNKTNEDRILEFDMKGNFVSSFGEIISKRNNINASTYQAYLPFLHGNGEFIVTATQFGEIIEIYNLKNKTQINLLGKKGYPEFQEINNMAINKGIMGFEDIYATNNYIYALFNGENVNERKIDQQGGKYIYIFNFDGKPLMKLNLNRYVSTFYVDDNDRMMYLLDVNTNDPLFTVELPSIINNH